MEAESHKDAPRAQVWWVSHESRVVLVVQRFGASPSGGWDLFGVRFPCGGGPVDRDAMGML